MSSISGTFKLFNRNFSLLSRPRNAKVSPNSILLTSRQESFHSCSKLSFQSKTNTVSSNFTFATKYPKNKNQKSFKKSSTRNSKVAHPKSIGLSIPSKFRLQKIPNASPSPRERSSKTPSIAAPFNRAEKGFKRLGHDPKKSIDVHKKSLDASNTRSAKKITKKPVDTKSTKKVVTPQPHVLLQDNQTLNDWFHESSQSIENHSTGLGLKKLTTSSPSSSQDQWPMLNLSQDSLMAIRKGLGFSLPSPVQFTFLQKVLSQDENSNIICGSQTGSGKTGAYLVALFEILKRQELELTNSNLVKPEKETAEISSPKSDLDLLVDQITDDGTMDDAHLFQEKTDLDSVRKLNRPRALVLVPSRILVSQVTQVAKVMSHHCKMRIVGIHSKTKHVQELLLSPIDILVTTPTSLLELMRERQVTLSQVQRIVFDEADTLFDRNFVKETSQVIEQVRAISKSLARPIPMYSFTATFPQSLNPTLKTLFPSSTGELVRLTMPSLHHPVKKVHHVFIRLSQSTTKLNFLVETLKRLHGTTNKVLVFCNTQQMVQQVHTFLESKSYPAVCISSSQSHAQVQSDLASFTSPSSSDHFQIAVSTDMASRGLDTTQVGHIINFCFPTSIIDYVHRIGRTGRFGRGGRVTNIIDKREMRKMGDVIDRVEMLVKRGLPLS